MAGGCRALRGRSVGSAPRRSRRRARAVAARAERVWVASGYEVREAELDAYAWEKVRVEVGIVADSNGPVRPQRTKLRSFALDKKLPGPSALLSVQQPRPLGVVFAPCKDGTVRVTELIDGSRAAKSAAVASLGAGGSVGAAVCRPGDVLRAVTTTVVNVPKSFGAQLLGNYQGATRTVILYGADGQGWQRTRHALRQGRVADGPVTLVLERPLESSPAVVYEPLPLEDEASAEPDDEEAAALAALAADDPMQALQETPSGVNTLALASLAAVALLFLDGFWLD